MFLFCFVFHFLFSHHSRNYFEADSPSGRSHRGVEEQRGSDDKSDDQKMTPREVLFVWCLGLVVIAVVGATADTVMPNHMILPICDHWKEDPGGSNTITLNKTRDGKNVCWYITRPPTNEAFCKFYNYWSKGTPHSDAWICPAYEDPPREVEFPGFENWQFSSNSIVSPAASQPEEEEWKVRYSTRCYNNGHYYCYMTSYFGPARTNINIQEAPKTTTPTMCNVYANYTACDERTACLCREDITPPVDNNTGNPYAPGCPAEALKSHAVPNTVETRASKPVVKETPNSDPDVVDWQLEFNKVKAEIDQIKNEFYVFHAIENAPSLPISCAVNTAKGGYYNYQNKYFNTYAFNDLQIATQYCAASNRTIYVTYNQKGPLTVDWKTPSTHGSPYVWDVSQMVFYTDDVKINGYRIFINCRGDKCDPQQGTKYDYRPKKCYVDTNRSATWEYPDLVGDFYFHDLQTAINRCQADKHEIQVLYHEKGPFSVVWNTSIDDALSRSFNEYKQWGIFDIYAPETDILDYHITFECSGPECNRHEEDYKHRRPRCFVNTGATIYTNKTEGFGKYLFNDFQTAIYRCQSIRREIYVSYHEGTHFQAFWNESVKLKDGTFYPTKEPWAQIRIFSDKIHFNGYDVHVRCFGDGCVIPDDKPRTDYVLESVVPGKDICDSRTGTCHTIGVAPKETKPVEEPPSNACHDHDYCLFEATPPMMCKDGKMCTGEVKEHVCPEGTYRYLADFLEDWFYGNDDDLCRAFRDKRDRKNIYNQTHDATFCGKLYRDVECGYINRDYYLFETNIRLDDILTVNEVTCGSSGITLPIVGPDMRHRKSDLKQEKEDGQFATDSDLCMMLHRDIAFKTREKAARPSVEEINRMANEPSMFTKICAYVVIVVLIFRFVITPNMANGAPPAGGMRAYDAREREPRSTPSQAPAPPPTVTPTTAAPPAAKTSTPSPPQPAPREEIITYVCVNCDRVSQTLPHLESQ